MATVMLNPGMVGLGILDSFVAKLPMVTSMCGSHSPEIAYLENGVNGLMTVADVNHYADAVVDLLKDETKYRTLQEGCARSAENISLPKMANRFCDGIERCLAEYGTSRQTVVAQ
jgi:glycosyltransferase involved in cell wall biosynthesis